MLVVEAGTREWGEVARDVGEGLVLVIETPAPTLLTGVTAVVFAGTGKGGGAAMEVREGLVLVGGGDGGVAAVGACVLS